MSRPRLVLLVVLALCLAWCSRPRRGLDTYILGPGQPRHHLKGTPL